MTELLDAFSQNYVLSEIKIDLPVRLKNWWDNTPKGFSTYPLMSMYEF
jgi:hypothetical protein